MAPRGCIWFVLLAATLAGVLGSCGGGADGAPGFLFVAALLSPLLLTDPIMRRRPLFVQGLVGVVLAIAAAAVLMGWSR